MISHCGDLTGLVGTMPFPGALCGEDLLPLHVRRLLSRLRLGHDGVSVVEVFELWKAREGSSLDRALVFAGGHRQGKSCGVACRAFLQPLPRARPGDGPMRS